MKKFVAKTQGVERTLLYDAATGRCELDGESFAASAVEIRPGLYSILIDGASTEVRVNIVNGDNGDVLCQVNVGDEDFELEPVDPRKWVRGGRNSQIAGSQKITAPMPGRVVRLLVSEGNEVKAGQGLVVVEAMKMQNEVRSPKGGHVRSISIAEGQTLMAGQPLMVIE